MSYRIGSGVDFHKLIAGRDLWLGGIKIPHSKGALGHSDADVLLHAICDALLGSLALGDIGKHFPDTDPAYKDADSKDLLKQVVAMIRKKGYVIVNIDATLCLEAPKIAVYIPQMQETISTITRNKTRDISIKATTTEKLGFVGREEGVVAYATVLIRKKK